MVLVDCFRMDQVQELKDRIISFETAKESYEKQIFDLERELGLSKLTTTILEERMEEAREEFAAKERIHLKMMRSVKKAMTVEGGVVSNSDGLRQAEAEQGEREAARKERNGATTNKRNGKRARAGKEVEGAPSSKRYYHVEDAEVIKKKHIDEFDRNQDKLLLSNKQILEKLKEHKFRTQCDDWSRLMRLTGWQKNVQL